MYDTENLKFILGPTNTGKTHYALERMLSYPSATIGLPLRLLAKEVYEKLCKKVGKMKVALITGEEQTIPSTSKYFVATVEAMPVDIPVDFAAVDEIQLCNDFERGHVFTDRLLNFRGKLETLFLGSDVMEDILKSIFPKADFIKKKRRSKLSYFGKKKLYSLPKRSAIIAFNTADIYEIASRLKTVKGGAAVVLGALSPQTRNSQVEMFEEGSVDYIVATDAIGMGLNLNIENIALSSLKKFDGKDFRYLKTSEIGQIAGRAGRNRKEGSFGCTLDCKELNSKAIDAIEKNNFEKANFLYWRSNDLNFDSLENFIKSLDKHSNDPKLVKTQNTKDEDLLRHLSKINVVRRKLINKYHINLLWEICTIPDYFKNLDNTFSEMLIKIFLDISSSGIIDHEWTRSEILKLQNCEGSIDMLTYRLSKTRFWNYVANKKNWHSETKEISYLARDSELKLSMALHKKLTSEFVDEKIRVIMKSYNLKKKLIVHIKDENKVFLNDVKVASIVNLKVKIYDQESIFSNKFIKKEIINKIKNVINENGREILKNTDKIQLDASGFIIYKKNKIGEIFKGDQINSPKVMLPNLNYLDEELNRELCINITKKIRDDIKSLFEGYSGVNLKNKTVNGLLFSLSEAGGIIEKPNSFKKSNDYEKILETVKKLNITIGNKFIFHNSVMEKKNRKTIWMLSNLYYTGKIKLFFPEGSFLNNAKEYNARSLRSIGFFKIQNIAVRIKVLESFYKDIYYKNRNLLLINFVQLEKYKLTKKVLYDILYFFGLEKIAGTFFVSFWKLKEKKYEKKIRYDKTSPFYVLKKLK